MPTFLNNRTMMHGLPELTSLSILIICSLVFLAGFIDSIVGGGGLISLPAYLAFGIPPHQALATNKFSSTLGTLTAVLRYLHAGHIQLKIAGIAALGALGGSALGGKVALLTKPETIQLVMLFLIPCVMVFFLLRNKIFPQKSQTLELPRHALLMSGLIGLIIGFYDGFFGPGTGAFLTIAFNVLLGLSLISASADARFTNLASNVGSLLVFLLDGKVLFPLALFAAAAGIAGNFLGSSLAVKKGEKVIRPLMIVVLVLLLVQIIRSRVL